MYKRAAINTESIPRIQTIRLEAHSERETWLSINGDRVLKSTKINFVCDNDR